MRLKLFHKFFVLMVILAVLPATIVGWRTININREGMQAAILELHTNMALSLADYTKNYLLSLERETQYVLLTMSGHMTWNDRQSVLQTLLDTNDTFISVSIVDKQGDELLKAYNPTIEKNPRLISRERDQTFITFWKDPATAAISPVYFDKDDPRLDIVFPLGEKHSLFATITLNELWKKITRTRIAATGYAYLINNQGEIIAHPNYLLAQNRTLVANLPIVQEAIQAVSVGSKEYFHPTEKKYIVGAYAPVERFHWTVIIRQDKDEAYISVRKMQNQAILLVLISLILASGLIYFIARDLTNPLVRLTKAAQYIANKNFNVRVKVNTHDELQDLAETFNDMTTELKRYDEMQVDKILTEKSKTELVMHSISEGMILLDLEARLQLANKKAIEILGLPQRSAWENKAVWNYIQNPAIKDALFEVINMTEKDKKKEIDLTHDKIPLFYEISTESMVTPEKNETIGIIAVFRDITLEKEIEKMKDNFLHSITHDLRNPLTSIRGFLKFLIDGVGGPVNEKQQKMLDTMNRASQRLMGLIDDILDIAKLESGRMHLNLENTDVSLLAQKTLELLEPQAMRKSVALTQDVPEHMTPIMADAKLIERVFINLVGNALKFTPDNGSVTIRLSEDEDFIHAQVIDTGEGIPEDYLTKIFDKFQQVEGQRRGGTGLGLTICKHIVEAHKGRIWAETKLKEGSTFKFTISKKLKESEQIHLDA